MTAAKVKVKVIDGWAVYDGTAQRHGGHQLDVDPDTAARWIAAGWVEPIEPKAPRKHVRR